MSPLIMLICIGLHRTLTTLTLRYYVNTTTQQSVWEMPTQPAHAPSQGSIYSPPPEYGHQQTPPAQGAAQGSPYNPAQQTAFPPPQGSEGTQLPAEGDGAGERGLGTMLGKKFFGGASNKDDHHKHHGFGHTAFGLGAGMLLGGVLGDKFKFGQQGQPPPGPPPQQQQQQYPPPQQQYYNQQQQQQSPPPQQQQYYSQQPQQQQQQQHHSSGGFFGGAFGGAATNAMSSFGGSPPPLRIISANYGGQDVTEKTIELAAAQNMLKLDNMSDDDLNSVFGNSWGGVSKSLVVLYSVGNRPMEIFMGAQAGGNILIDPRDPLRPDRTEYFSNEGPVIAVIWGLMLRKVGPVSAHIVKEIASYRSFEATSDYFGFDGWKDNRKTCVIFLRNGDRIYNTAFREGATARL